MSVSSYICWFGDLTSNDVASVGRNNASLGEMVRNLRDKGIRVPDRFAIGAGTVIARAEQAQKEAPQAEEAYAGAA